MARVFTVTIECDNASFDDDINAEAARILLQIANDVVANGIAYQILVRDSNGNVVGETEFDEDA